MAKQTFSLASLCAIAVLSSCGPGATRMEDLDTTLVTLPDGQKLVAETMIRDIDVTRGMMFRDALPPARGMLLIFPRPDRHRVFTYNCRVPLDVVWLDRDQRIVEIAENLPPCKEKSAKACPIYGGTAISKYAIELNGGGAAAYKLKVGDKVSF
jgi:uncharacterized membrane protein (UPF0127 family)